MSEPPLCILYVDDEPLLLYGTKEYLGSLGFIVDIAESAALALHKITETTYHAIVSDYQMPGMNGIEFLKEIRRRNLDIPFILFTGRGREEVVIEAIEHGADFYVQKGGKPAPQFSELTHKIRMAVSRRNDTRALLESELRFRSLIQNSSDIIRILHPDGTILFDSPSSSTILGYPEGALVGLRAFDFIHPEDQERVLRDFQDVENKCNSQTPTEYRIRKADGTYLYVESIGLNLIGVPGIDGIVTTTHPIEHQKEAEMKIRKMAEDLSAAYEELSLNQEELRENYQKLALQEESLAKSEERFRGMAERSSDLIIILDKRMNSTYISPSCRVITGYEPEELIDTSSEFGSGTIFALCQTEFMRCIQTILAGNHVDNVDLTIKKKDGSFAFVNLNAVPILEKRVISGAQISLRDITAMKEAELALLANEEKFERFANNARDMLYRMSLPDGIYEYISPALKDLTGYSPEEFYGNPGIMRTLIHPSWEQYFQEKWDALLTGDVPPTYEYQIIDRSGNVRWINQRNVLIVDNEGKPVALEGIVSDVTHQKATEYELRKSEQRLLAVTSNAGAWIWEVDPTGLYTYSSSAVEAILGYSPEELVGKLHFYDLFDSARKDEMTATAMSAFRDCKPFCDFINSNRHKDGSLVILQTSGTPVYNESGIFSGYSGIDQDITKEKEAEEKLVESETRYRLLADNVHDVIWTADNKMRMTYISPSIRKLQGYTSQEAMNLTFRDSLTPDSYRKLVQCHIHWMNILQSGGKIPEKTVMELEFVRKDSSTVWTEMIIAPVFTNGESFQGVVGVTRDITQRRQAAITLKNANRQLNLLTSITRHDILNKISIIFVFLELAEKEEMNSTLSEYLRIMKNTTQEIQSQIEFTRVYEDLGVQKPQWISLKTVLPRSCIPESIHFLESDLNPWIFADPMLEKVFSNLLDNSVRHGKTVTEVRVSLHESESDLVIVWEDNGVGIPDRLKEQIFERGFGKNTGLGMFLVREILSLTGISIQETGEEGRGVRFEMLVPQGTFRYE